MLTLINCNFDCNFMVNKKFNSELGHVDDRSTTFHVKDEKIHGLTYKDALSNLKTNHQTFVSYDFIVILHILLN